MTITAVVLAAGMSTRFGQQKLLLPLRGRPLIRHAVDNVLGSMVDDVIVVMGRDENAVSAALAGMPVTLVVNPRYADGLSTSLNAGVSALPAQSEAAIITLGDQPMVTPAIVDRIIEIYWQSRKSIIVPIYNGVRGNPVLFARSVFPELRAMSGDEGARSVITSLPFRVQQVSFPFAMPRDVDTREDYDALLKAARDGRVV